MCGILGYVGAHDARGILLDGLRRMEYRGYDSAGISVARDGVLHTARVAGRVGALNVDTLPEARAGIAHTRWATHGPPTVANAHPHTCCAGDVAVVHNGIIENHDELRRRLEASGHSFRSDTDTEVVAHLIEDAYDGDLLATLSAVCRVLKGSYALVVAHAGEPGAIAVARQGSPLVLGLVEDGAFVASDVVAFREHTDLVMYLDDGDVARLTPGGPEFRPGRSRAIETHRVPWALEAATLAGFPHFMLKEVHDQPRSLQQALLGRTDPGGLEFEGSLSLEDLAARGGVLFTACGSSYNAALAASQVFEAAADVPTTVTLASEFEPRSWMARRAALLAVSQSGETADTLSAVRAAGRAGFDTFAVANVVGSTITRTAHAWLPIRAGPEVSVAATKSFTSQLAALHAIAWQLAAASGTRPTSAIEDGLDALRGIPTRVRAALDDAAPAANVGRWIADHDHAFVLGRGVNHALALETALKIKEVSYVHAEGLAAGELKHGPLALIQDGTPVLAFAPAGTRLAAMMSSMREVAARGGHVVAVTDDVAAVEDAGFDAVAVPAGPSETFVYPAAILGQLVAYHAAVARGCDVDRPRNLAKSVTVE